MFLTRGGDLKPIIVLGGGGHASVLVDILREQERVILAIISPDGITNRSSFTGIPHLRNDDDVLGFSSSEVLLVNGIGALPKNDLRFRVARYFLKLGYVFETVVSSHAIISPHATLASGSQILHNAVVQSGAFIGENTIVNTGAIVEHDCYVGMNSHVAPRATLCGQVNTGQNVYIGAGATVIQDTKIGDNILIGAGAIIVSDIPDGHTIYGYRSLIKIGIS